MFDVFDIKGSMQMVRLNMLLLLVAMLFGASTAKAQFYHDGERLEYRVSYRAKLFPNTEVATATVTTSLDTLDGKTHYKVFGQGRMMPAYRWFYDIDDRYTIWVDTATLRTRRLLSEIAEGSYRKRSTFDYDWHSMTSHNTWVRKNGKVHECTIALTDKSMDAISLFFNLRGVDLDSFREDEEYYLEMMLEDTIRVLRYRFLGREQKKIRRLGKFKTLKFRCQIGAHDAQSFKDGSEFFIWISDDENKVPLWLESPIRVGSICAYLVEPKGLKYPLKSKVK